MRYEVLFRVINEDEEPMPWIKATAMAPDCKISKDDCLNLSFALGLYMEKFIYSQEIYRMFPLKCFPTVETWEVSDNPLEDDPDIEEADKLIREYLNRYPLRGLCIRADRMLPAPKQL